MKKSLQSLKYNLILIVLLLLFGSLTACMAQTKPDPKPPMKKIPFHLLVQSGVSVRLEKDTLKASPKPYPLSIKYYVQKGRIYFTEPLHQQEVSFVARNLQSISMTASHRGLSIIANYKDVISNGSRCCVSCPETGTSAYGMQVWLDCNTKQVCCGE